MKNLREIVGTNEPSNLIASVFETDVFSVTLRALASETELKKGTVLALSSTDSKYVILGTTAQSGEGTTETLTANAILAEDVKVGTSDVVATAFRQGHFNRNALAVKTSYSITVQDIEALRNAGIYLEESI